MEEKNTDLTMATGKMRELLTCDNERVALSAAKELISIAGAEAEQRAKESENNVHLEVSIRIVE